jgi:hypothetical protein
MADEKEVKIVIDPPLGSRSVATTSASFVTMTLMPAHPIPAFTGTPVSEHEIIEYEAGMFFRTFEMLFTQAERLDELALRNAVTEDALLHARNLCGVFLDGDRAREDDIVLYCKPRSQAKMPRVLFPDWEANHADYKEIKEAVSKLRDAYGDDKPGTCRYAFNKMAMHTTKHRGAYGVYDDALRLLEPILHEIVGHIESLKGFRFKPIE